MCSGRDQAFRAALGAHCGYNSSCMAKWFTIQITKAISELAEQGPTVEAFIGPRDCKRMIGALAQLDTGASGTGISPRLADMLNLPSLGSTSIREAGREVIESQFYEVRLILPRLDLELKVAGLPSLAPPHDIRIGRDVLAGCKLVVDFTTGVTVLGVPPPAEKGS